MQSFSSSSAFVIVLSTYSFSSELYFFIHPLSSQMFVATVSPARDETASYVAWGHSSVVDPWYASVGNDSNGVVTSSSFDLHFIIQSVIFSYRGIVLASTDSAETIVYSDLGDVATHGAFCLALIHACLLTSLPHNTYPQISRALQQYDHRCPC